MKRRPRSFLFSLSFLLVAFIVLVVTFVIVITHNMREQRRLQLDFIGIVSLDNSIILGIDEASTCIKQYRDSWNDEYYQIYSEKIDDLFGMLDKYRLDEEKHLEEDIQRVRRLEGFLDYQLKMLKQAYPDEGALFSVISYVLDGLYLHSTEMHLAFHNDLTMGSENLYNRESVTEKILVLTLSLFMAALLLIFMLFVMVQRKTIQIIRQMDQNLTEISNQHWDAPDLDDPYFVEFKPLFTSVNLAKDRLHRNFNELESKAEIEHQLSEQRVLLVESQLEMLKMQVNPHFLFNALHLIGMSSLLNEPEKVMKLVESTGDILRYSLYNKDSFVDLADELRIIETYVYLQKESTDKKIEFSINCPKEMEANSVPPMCIQPIVENCFKHSLPYFTGDVWVLRIDCSLLDDYLCVKVFDNGPGVTENKSKKNSGIGLENIRKRLELEYNREDLLKIRSEKGVFTEVELRFPIQG